MTAIAINYQKIIGNFLYWKYYYIIEKKMAVIKLTKKEKLDQLVARITLQTGIKPTQQDVLDAAVELAETHFDELQTRLAPKPLLDKSKVRSNIGNRKRYPKLNGMIPQIQKIEIKMTLIFTIIEKNFTMLK